MGGVGYVGFLSYAICLWLITGILMLWVDVKGYEMAGMGKERNVCRFIGWLNICLGVVVFVGNLSLRKWGW